jgi:1-acyl-sn-glycerol-3-phosphate acyltransferase
MRRQLDYCWRLAATGAAFAFIFFGGCLLAVTLLPLLAIIPGHTRERAQTVIHRSFRFYIGALQALGLIRFDMQGKEKLADGRGKLVVANHPSLLDVVVLMALIPRSQCIVKYQLWSHPLLGPLVRRAGYIRNDLDPEALIDACKQAVARGDSLIIFPEGTRSQPDRPPHFRRGFANLAALAGAPIQPVTLSCEPPTLTKGEAWWHIPPHRPLFRVKVNDYVDATDDMQYPYRSIAVRRLVENLELRFAEDLANGKLSARS